MRAASYDHSEILSSELTILNSTSALNRQAFSRYRRDGSEISPAHRDLSGDRRIDGRRISALAVHSP